MKKKRIQLEIYTPDGEWPKCYYDQDLLCGHRDTGKLKGYHQEDPNHQGSWHIADMCNCPSCPLRCAIRDRLAKEE